MRPQSFKQLLLPTYTPLTHSLGQLIPQITTSNTTTYRTSFAHASICVIWFIRGISIHRLISKFFYVNVKITD